ncbi:MAG: hypothetical protein WBA74_04900 [Cyclobacteriaceae bacterium]
MIAKFVNLLSYCIIALLLFNCSSSRVQQKGDPNDQLQVKSSINNYKENVSFELQNVSDNEIIIESTTHLQIERFDKHYNYYTELPYLPCKCGTPCLPPSSVTVGAGKSIAIIWNRLMVTCDYSEEKRIPDTISSYQEKGKYRISFVYYPVVDQVKTTRKTLSYEFSLK